MSDSDYQYHINSISKNSRQVLPGAILFISMLFFVFCLIRLGTSHTKWYDYLLAGLSAMATLVSVVRLVKSFKEHP